MKILRLREILFCVLLSSSCDVTGLKCRTTTDSQQNNDFEYVVRMCLRHLRNESDIYDLYRIQNDYDFNGNKNRGDETSGNGNGNSNGDRNYYNRHGGYSEGFDRFWPPTTGSHDSRNRYGDDDRYRQDGDYMEGDYFGGPRNGKDGRKKFRMRPQVPPHSYQQQLQHDREMYGRGSRDGYFYSNRNKNTKSTFNRDRNYVSPLSDIDPCVVHCIFQEMQMVDDNGKPNKGLISQKMTQNIRNSELKNFIQESVEDCFDAIDDNDFENNYNNNNNNKNNNNNNSNRYRKPEAMCDWAKTFALCLEDKGRENCDDWEEPMQKNHSTSGSSSGKTNEDQRHKSKQNDRG